MKTAVIYWSGTGNTEAMAKAVAEGAGAECFAVSEFSGNVEDYDAIALGCPAMGAEELEDSEFEPFFAGIEGKLKNPGFLANAPEAVVAGEQEKAEKLRRLIAQLTESAARLQP